jgi:hypothetical protein
LTTSVGGKGKVIPPIRLLIVCTQQPLDDSLIVTDVFPKDESEDREDNEVNVESDVPVESEDREDNEVNVESDVPVESEDREERTEVNVLRELSVLKEVDWLLLSLPQHWSQAFVIGQLGMSVASYGQVGQPDPEVSSTSFPLNMIKGVAVTS